MQHFVVLYQPHSSVLAGCLARTRPWEILWRIQECRVGAAALFIQIFNGLCNMLTFEWSGILIKEFWNFSCGMYSMKMRFQTSSCLNLAVRIHISSLGIKLRETQPILSKMTLSHVPSCLWPTFTFNLLWRCCVVPFLWLWLGFGFILLQKFSSTMVVCERKFLLLVLYWCKQSLANASMTLDVHFSASMVPCEHRTWNVKAH